MLHFFVSLLFPGPLIITLPDERLGLQVRPGKVRLRPRPEDQYRWSVAEPMRKYFQTNLSEGSLGCFQKIYDALERGNMIEAVPVNNLEQDDSVAEVFGLMCFCAFPLTPYRRMNTMYRLMTRALPL